MWTILVHSMKAYEGMDVLLHSILSSVLKVGVF